MAPMNKRQKHLSILLRQKERLKEMELVNDELHNTPQEPSDEGQIALNNDNQDFYFDMVDLS
jgi:hypothetical protein